MADGKPAALLLDTGADPSIISPQAAGISAKLDTLKPTSTTGSSGEYVKGRVDLRLAERHWISRAVLVMDLSEASKGLGMKIDGFVGETFCGNLQLCELITKRAKSSLRSKRDAPLRSTSRGIDY